MLRLFGTVEAGPESAAPTPVTAPRPRLIVALLGANLGERVPVQRLVDALWPDDPPRTAISALQVYISKIRRLFEPDLAPRTESRYLRLEAAAYVLDLPVHEVDTRRFAALGRTDATTSSADAEVRWREALALWADPPFAEFADAPWAIAAGNELRRTRISICRGLYAEAITEGRDAEIIDELSKDYDTHPFDERLAGLLMTAQYRLGDQAAALATGARVRTHLREELGLEPTPELRELERLILDHDASLLEGFRIRPPQRRGAAIERPPLFGRHVELGRIRRALDTHRLVTITGPGGVGKTRLAHEIADTTERALFVDLTPVERHDQVIDHIAVVLGIDGDPLTDPAHALAAAIGDRCPLLVLDNVEHLLPGLADVAAELMGSDETFGILVTSRRTLHLSTEHLIRLESFETPDPDDPEMASDPGIRILTAHSGTSIGTANAAQFAALHERLDGLPLALELAAFQLRTLGIDDVLTAPPDSAHDAPRDKPERHRSLDALVASSIADLDDSQRDLLERMSVFAGPVPLEAVVRLMARVASPVDVRIGVSELVDRSLVAMSTDGPVRYRLLETVRSHCRARVADAGRLDEVHDSHRHLVRSTAAASLTGDEVVFRLDDLDDDVAAALDRFERRADDAAEHLGFVMTIATYWYGVNRVGEARTRLRRALALHPDADPVSAGTANALLGMISFGDGAFHELATATRRALDLLEPLGFPGLDFVRAGHHVGAGELPQARAAIEVFLADGVATGRPLLAGLEVAANAAWFAGDHETAARWFDTQRSAARDQGDPYFEAHALRGAAMMTAILGRPELGVDMCREADELAVSDRQPRVVTERHASAAVVRFALGDNATAAREAAAVLELSTRHFDAHSAALAVPIACACSLATGDAERVALISGWFDSLQRSTGLYPPQSSADLLTDVVGNASEVADSDRWIQLRADGATGGLAAALAT